MILHSILKANKSEADLIHMTHLDKFTGIMRKKNEEVERECRERESRRQERVTV